MIFSILEIFEHINKDGSKVIVKWYYESDDEDILDAGKTMAEGLNLPFEYKSYFME